MIAINNKIFNKYNVNLAVIPKLGWTIGHVVAVSGDWQHVEQLLTIGLNADKGDKFGWTARQLSVDIHGADIFNGEKCDGNVVPDMMGITDVHIAAINGKFKPIQDHLLKDMDAFYKKDCFGYTPLEYLEMLHRDGNFYQNLINIYRELDA